MTQEIPVTPNGEVLRKILEERDPVFGVRASFNAWIRDRLPRQLDVYQQDFGDYVLKFYGLLLMQPTTTVMGVTHPKLPHQALLLKSSYMSELKTGIRVYRKYDWDLYQRRIEDGEFVAEAPEPVIDTDGPVTIGQIPCMVKSELCTLHEMTDDELMAKGEDYRDPGGYFIIDGVSRLTFLDEKLAVNRYRLGSDDDGNYCNIIAETIRGTMTTYIRTIKTSSKNAMGTSLVHLNLSDAANRNDRTKTQRIQKTINIFKAIRVYVRYVKGRWGEYGDAMESYYSDPNTLMSIVLRFIKPERHSKIKTFLADTLYDAIVLPNGEEYLREAILGELTIESVESRGMETLIHVLDSSILSHLPSSDPDTKIYTLLMMVAILAEFETGYRISTDKDDWTNKRLGTSAKKCEQLFRGFLKTFARKVVSPFTDSAGQSSSSAMELTLQNLEREVANQQNFISEGFKTSFKSQYGLHTVNSASENPVQRVQRGTFLEFSSMISRIDVPNLSRRTKSYKTRGLGAEQWGGVCIGETVESESVGIVKAKAVTAQTTVEGDIETIMDFLNGEATSEASSSASSSGTPLYIFEEAINDPESWETYTDVLLLNGRLLGWCNGEEVRQKLVQARRQRLVDLDVSVVYDNRDGYLYVHTDEGRLSRPLFVVNSDGNLSITPEEMLEKSFDDMVRDGQVEFIDLYEQSFARLATGAPDLVAWKEDLEIMQTSRDAAIENGDDNIVTQINQSIKFHLRNRYTHMEIHPAALLGVSLSIMPFLSHNQAPRITYQSKMGTQALGNPYLNHTMIFENETKILRNATRPLVINQLNRQLKLDLAPQGQTLQVAFLALRGDTQEDAFYVKEEAVNTSLALTKYITIEVKISPNHELRRPEPHRGEDPMRYRFLTNDGLPMINAPLNQGDYIVGRIRTDRNNRNVSVALKLGEYGIVDTIFMTRRGNDEILQIKLRQDRNHAKGDKLTSRYAQKGTTSRIIPGYNLPFDEATGETPDMVVNPHCVPKRMTMGYMMEPLMGMFSALTGQRYNGSAFDTHDVSAIYHELEKFGFTNKGYRWFRDPVSGERTKARVFMGPVYIQVLRHLGPEKLQIRSEGVVKALTRQPPQDSAYGGRRVGEMERNAMMSHGASEFLMERMIKMSDEYTAAFCEECGDFAVVKPNAQLIECPRCGEGASFVRSTIPYVYKLLHQLLMGTGSFLRFQYTDDPDEDEVEDDEESITFSTVEEINNEDDDLFF